MATRRDREDREDTDRQTVISYGSTDVLDWRNGVAPAPALTVERAPLSATSQVRQNVRLSSPAKKAAQRAICAAGSLQGSVPTARIGVWIGSGG